MFSFSPPPKSEKIPSWVTGIIFSLILLSNPVVVLAHPGHNNEFKSQTETTTPTGIFVDSTTAKRMGIKVAAIKPQILNTGMKTTGEITTLPNNKIEITAPIPGTIVELLVQPGEYIKKGQVVAVLSSLELVQLRVDSQEKRVSADSELKQLLADLTLAQENLSRQKQIATAEIEEAQTELKVAQEQYDQDRDLVKQGALPRRQMLESQAHFFQSKAALTKANSRREILATENQVKRAEAGVAAAKSRIGLSDRTYKTRLQQLGNIANSKGLVTVISPISGQVADREVTLGQSFQDAGEKLMTIIDNSRVLATANIYEKDLEKIKKGQQVRVKVASLPTQTFLGNINLIGSTVENEKRVIPVKAELINTNGALKPGMFAELEVLTNNNTNAVVAIPSQSVVDVNGKQVVYVQNGENYQPVEVTLGVNAGNLVEVKSGLFAGDLLVTQGGMQLYAQSLRGGGKKEEESHHSELKTENSMFPWWWVLPVGGGLSVGGFWLGRLEKKGSRKGAESAERELEGVREKC
jgi:membrane fusion protein, heavy metal efflux system